MDRDVLSNRKGRQSHNTHKLIIYSSQYSEDEVSDLSLDELTDEEPEDLRATLNKNKHLIRVS